MLTKNKNLSCQNMMEKGYTLIQMALALMVIGVLLAGFLGIYTQYQVEEKVTKTNTRVNNALQSIQKYRNVFGTLPCPAPMNVARTDAAYGMASNYARYTATGALPVVAGGCAEGICIEQNTRTDLAGTPTLRVRVGAIPFRDMQLDESDTYDAYGSRLWYAVTEDLCNLATFNETRGAINIVNDLGETQTTPPNSAAFVVISPGVNKIGGYGLEGTLQVPCATSLDSENCRDVSLATSAITSATYRSQFVQDASLATSYDDVIEFFASAQTQLWRRTAPGAEDILDLANNVIGIGETSPSATLDIAQSAVSSLPIPGSPVVGTLYKGDIAPTNNAVADREHGALRVGPTTSKLQADVYCNEGGTNCFRPENIMGTTGLTCPAGQYPTAITSDVSKDAKFICKEISVNCPAGQTFTGFTNSAGNLIPTCSGATAFAACPTTSFSLCSANDVTLSAAPHDITTPFTRWKYSPIVGACRQNAWMCNNGTWQSISTVYSGWPSGSCVNTATTSTGLSCATTSGPCWTGTYSSTSLACGGGSNTRATDCLCTACTRTITGTCPAPLTGTGATTSYDYICPGPTPQTAGIINPLFPSGTVTTPSSCSCSLSPYNTFYDCPSGYIRDAAAPPLVPNTWPGDINKGKYEVVNVSGTCTHVNSGLIINHCTCDLADKYTTFQPVPATCMEPIPGSRVVGSSSFDWKFDVNKVTKNAVGCTDNPPVLESAAQFQAVNTYWREVAGSYTSTVSSKPAGVPEVGEACNCLANAPIGTSTSTCVKAGAVSGDWDSYQCVCNL